MVEGPFLSEMLSEMESCRSWHMASMHQHHTKHKSDAPITNITACIHATKSDQSQALNQIQSDPPPLDADWGANFAA